MADNRNVTNNLGSTPAMRHSINQEQAQQVVRAAAMQVNKIKSPSDIAVVDPAGYLVAFLRTDNAYLGSIDISMKKARTVALFNGALTTAAWGTSAQPGGNVYGIEQTNGGLIVFGGGVPIFKDGYFIGAVGVSGGTVEQDIDIATVGVNAVGTTM
ncbi:hypothetical protein LTR66_005859 [Elasticomyces elasticus]|nr:hypothetical protein LTR66_005859 [Elasticomyces elasticus]